MKSRAIQTRFWDDEKVVEFSSYAKYLYIYLLTCQYINVSGVFQLSAKKIQFETALTEKQYADAQEELSRVRKVLFHDGWVYVLNAEKNNNYRKIPSNEKTYQQEWERVPNNVRDYFTSDLHVADPSDTSQGLRINNKSQIINNKSQIINKKQYKTLQSINNPELFTEIANKYETTPEFVASRYEDLEIYCTSKNKRYADYYFALLNFVKSGMERKSISYKNNGTPNIVFINPE